VLNRLITPVRVHCHRTCFGSARR